MKFLNKSNYFEGKKIHFGGYYMPRSVQILNVDFFSKSFIFLRYCNVYSYDLNLTEIYVGPIYIQRVVYKTL